MSFKNFRRKQAEVVVPIVHQLMTSSVRMADTENVYQVLDSPKKNYEVEKKLALLLFSEKAPCPRPILAHHTDPASKAFLPTEGPLFVFPPHQYRQLSAADFN